jgi:proline iminopeptidase
MLANNELISIAMTKTDWKFNQQGYTKVPGGQIWYGIVGDLSKDATPLLVIHGGPGMSHDYLYSLTNVAADRPVIFYDQLDSGLSDRPNDPINWNLPRFLAEVDAIRNDLELAVVSIFGNSWGGTIAAAYTAAQPKGIERLILSSPLINSQRWVADNNVYREELPADILLILNQCEANNTMDSKTYEDAVNIFYKRHFCRIDPWPDYLTKTFELLNADCYATMWGPNEFTCNGLLKDYDGAEELSTILVPTLITCGEFDEATPASCQDFTSMIPGATFAMFKDASHLAFIEDRKNYISTIRQFLQT